MAKFVLTVASNTVPPRLGKVVVDPAESGDDFCRHAWKLVYSADVPMPPPEAMEWQHLDGSCS